MFKVQEKMTIRKKNTKLLLLDYFFFSSGNYSFITKNNIKTR